MGVIASQITSLLSIYPAIKLDKLERPFWEYPPQ